MDKRSVLKDILGKTENIYSKVQRGINRAADKVRRPLMNFPRSVDNVKDLPGVRQPIISDIRNKFIGVKKDNLSRQLNKFPNPTQMIPSPRQPLITRPNFTTPGVIGSKLLTSITKPGNISKPLIGNIKRPL